MKDSLQAKVGSVLFMLAMIGLTIGAAAYFGNLLIEEIVSNRAETILANGELAIDEAIARSIDAGTAASMADTRLATAMSWYPFVIGVTAVFAVVFYVLLTAPARKNS